MNPRISRGPAVVLLLLAWLPASSASPVFRALSPLSGPPGTVVRIDGSGFDPQTSYSLRVGGKSAEPIFKEPSGLEFVVPSGVQGGLVTVIGAGVTNDLPMRFTVTRRIAGRFQPPTGVLKSGYDAMGYGGFTAVDAGTGAFSVDVPVDVPHLVWVFAGESQPAYLAMVTPSMPEVTVDAHSTALALPFLVPALATRDPVRATALLQRAEGRPETEMLSSAIRVASTASADYLDDARVEGAWASLVAVLGAPAPALAPARAPAARGGGVAPHTLAAGDLFLFKGLTPDYSGSIPATPPSLTPTLEPVPDSVLDDARFVLKPESHSNVDWFVEIFGLDPTQFAGGRAGIERLVATNTPRRLPGGPLQIGVVRSKLESKNINLPGLIADKVASLVFGPLEEEFGQNSFKLRSLPPGVYVSQAYSGNLWYGTRVLLPGTDGGIFSRHQSDVITNLDASWEWGESLAANITVAIVDGVSIFVPADALIDKPEAWHKLVRTLFIDVSKMIQIYQDQRQVDIDTVWDFVTTVSKSALKGVIDLGFEALGKDGNFLEKLGRFGKVGGKFVAKSINIFKKVSSGLQVAERTSGLLLPNSLALERSVMVVGDPFVPQIEAFSPRRGRGGDWVFVQGRNFPTVSSNITVTFCQFGSTADPTAVTASLKAQVLATTADSMTIVVPTNARAMFPNGRAFLCAETATGRSSTTGLPEFFREYFFEEPPRPVAVVNGPVPAGGVLRITGTGFTPNGRTPDLAEIAGPTAGSATIVMATETEIALRLSTGLPDGAYTVRFRAGAEAYGETIGFQVATPSAPPPQGSEGLGINVTRLDMVNARDGEISLYEAFHLANGTLGRPIEVHLPCEFLPRDDPSACPFVRREIDSVSGADPKTGAGGGPGSRDVVIAKLSATPIPAGKLPPPVSGDRYVLPLILDGADAAPGQDGWLLDGTSGVVLEGATFRNFPGHGVHLRHLAYGNVLNNITVEGAGKTGVYLEGDAFANRLSGLLVVRAALDGLVFSGAGVLYNTVDGPRAFGVQPKIGVTGCGGWGVSFEDGAQWNFAHTGPVRSNAFGGVRFIGSKTAYNRFGRPDRTALVRAAVQSNGGPGIRLGPGVHHTVLAYLNVGGNRGDGIELEGPGCAFNHLDGIMTSFVEPANGAPAAALPNEGSGIHLRAGAHDNLLGTLDPGLNFPFNLYGPDRDYNLLLEGAGTAFNLVTAGNFGTSDVLGVPVLLPAGLGAVALVDGSHDNVVGHENADLANYFLSWNRAGVLVDDSARNRVYGNYLTGVSTLGGVAGVRLANGARDNNVGKPGKTLFVPRDFDRLRIQFGNVIEICSEAGIAVEGAGGTVDAAGRLQQPNRIRNNEVRNNATGILLGRQAWANAIGGPNPGDGNVLLGSRVAEVRFANNPLPDRAWRNRLENNRIGGSSFGIGGPPQLPFLPAPDPGDHLFGPIPRVGVLVDASSTNQVIGEDMTTANLIQLDLVGIYLDGGTGTLVRGNRVERNVTVGLVVRDGRAHEIGGLNRASGNTFQFNGRGLAEDGGVVLAGGGGHTLRHATVGGTANLGNRGFGLLIDNSAGNTIGATANAAGNEFTFNGTHGVWLRGAGATENQFGNNFIGIDRKNRPAANFGDGVHIEAGASNNRIGGDLIVSAGSLSYPVSVGNEIAHNLGDGVAVFGAGSVGNSILNNRITGNVGLGIRLAGGNFDQPPPRHLGYDDFTLSGTVVDPTVTPPGSLIQVFSDPDPLAPEGEHYLGEAVVRVGGAFFVRLLRTPVGMVTMTATHAVHRSTSPFGSGSILPIGFLVERAGAVVPSNVAAGTVGFPALPLALTAVNSDVRVESITLTARGTLAPDSGITAVQIFRDADRNGVLSEADTPLGATGLFAASGRSTLVLSNAVVNPGQSDRWLVVLTVAGSAAAGRDFQVEVTDANAVAARFIPTLAAVRPLGGFPVASALNTVAVGLPRQTFAGWQSQRFTPTQLGNPSVSGESANPDGDAFINLGEYAFGLDPLRADSDPATARLTAMRHEAIPAGGADGLELSYARRPDPVDLEYALERAIDGLAWETIPPGALALLGSAPEEGNVELTRVRYRVVQDTGAGVAPWRGYYRLRVRRVP